MLEMTALSRAKSKYALASFTLVELLTVMTIIAILAALTLAAASGVMTKAKRNRAAGEIQAMSSALEGYKADNGIYAPSDGTQLLTNTPYTSYDGTSVNYQTNGQLLYQALSGQTNFTATPISGRKAYMSFKQSQIGDPTGTVSGGTYVQDPWGYCYGYSTGNAANFPYNGSGFFDLWSTGGLLKAQVTATPNLTNAWISNWR